jgi:hypothetical protein
MKRPRSIRFVAAPLCAAVALLWVAAFAGSTGSTPQAKSGQPQAAQNVFPQPDTSSPDWKAISDDLGIWIGKSDHVGVRGRLYVRRGDSWMPVAVDSAADIHGVFPAGK